MSLGEMRMAALVVVVAGGAGAVGLTLYAGRANHQPLLMVLMAVWVSAPFLVLAVANRRSLRWPLLVRAALNGVTIVVTILALAVFSSTVLNPPRTTRGFVFVAIPLVAWLLMATAIPIAAVIARRQSPP